MKYSVIVICEQKRNYFYRFIKNLQDIFLEKKESFEILVIANGTEGFVRNEFGRLSELKIKSKVYSFHKKTSQAVCLKAGMRESKGQIVFVCGSYQQLTNESISQLVDSLDDGTDIVTPWRQSRVDPRFNQLQSKLFNLVVQWIIKTNIHDLSCPEKVLRREVLDNIDLYGNMFRFLPIIAERKGFRIKEVKTRHYQAQGETGFYKMTEYMTRIIDIFTLFFNTRFTRKPLRFFSFIGTMFIIAGLTIFTLVLIQRIYSGYPIGGSAIFLLSIFCMVLGVQAASVGLLGKLYLLHLDAL